MDGASGWQLLSNGSGKKKLLVLNLQLFYDNNNNNNHKHDCQRRTCTGSQAKVAAKHSVVVGSAGALAAQDPVPASLCALCTRHRGQVVDSPGFSFLVPGEGY